VLDLKLIRDNPQGFDEALARRGIEPLSETILALDAERRQTITSLQEAQSRRNAASKEIGKAKGARDEDKAQALMAEVGALKETIAAGEAREKELSAQLDDYLAGTPNLPGEDVPVGDEDANEEIRLWGEPPKFDFEPKQHFELGEALGQMDFETAAKMSGSRFVLLRRDLARLERALAAFMLDLQTREFGYEEVAPPFLVRDDAVSGTGQLPKFTDDLFQTADEALDKRLDELWIKHSKGKQKARADHPVKNFRKNFKQIPPEEVFSAVGAYYEEKSVGLVNRHWLVPTAEVPLTNMVREDILEEAKLPFRFTAHTPCFRSEAGAAGKDTRGMIRLHQFSKVELVSITTPEQSEAEHERMTEAAETVLQRLGLPYRTMVLASGDMGFSARKTYDIEVWLPGQSAFREISSCSNCGDFQARRMNARYRPSGAKDLRFVHTLNGSGLAVGRTLVAVLENYQQADGSIRIPEALSPYMGGLDVIEAAG